MKKKFDMEKIRRFVLEKIYECLESDSVCILSNLTALAQFSDIEKKNSSFVKILLN